MQVEGLPETHFTTREVDGEKSIVRLALFEREEGGEGRDLLQARSTA